MRKFYFNPKSPRGIYELEVTPVVSFCLHSSEFLYRISAPVIFNNEEWYSWAMQDSLEDCRIHAWYALMKEYESNNRRSRVQYTIEDLISVVENDHNELIIYNL